MGYHRIDPADVDPTPDHPCDRRPIADAASLGSLAAAVYELAPGEQLPTTYHSHERREELFYVHSGTLHVETPEETYRVPAQEVFVAEPESPHRAFAPADADAPVTVFGVGSHPFDVGRPYDPATEAPDRRDGEGGDATGE